MVPCSRCPATLRHQRVASLLRLARFPEVAAFEETLPDVLNPPLHLGLVLGVPNPGRVSDETAVLGILDEAAGDSGMQGVGSRQGGGEIVDNHVLGDAVEEGLGRLQPVDDILKLLAEGGPDEAMPGVAQHQYQRPHLAAAAGARVMDQAQPAEVQLHHLARGGVLHTDGHGIAPPPVSALDEAAQRRIGNLAAPLQQQLQYAGQLQAVDGEPLIYLVAPWGK